MKTRVALAAALFWAAFSGPAFADSAGTDLQISGLKPFQRPDGAPSIDQVTRDKAWYARALTGISKPYPASLGFLNDQGNWYTPFDRPGMFVPYDIRGWHAR